jgi:hypothetical protein
MAAILMGQSVSRDGTPLVAIRMSEKAAERLAKACREAYNAVLDELQVEDRKPRAREDEMLEMLDWASRWLVFPDAREEVKS